MNLSVVYIAVSIVVLVIIAIVAFLLSRRGGDFKLTPLMGLSWGFVMAGIVFGDDRLIGYGLLGVGVVLAIVDVIRRLRTAT
ncbi:MAG: hypothetical protein PVG11_07780 [Anaerolineae bacterium]|jgi:hypothetical protein